MEDLVLSLLPRSDKLTVERRRMEGGELEQNSCILVAIIKALHIRLFHCLERLCLRNYQTDTLWSK